MKKLIVILASILLAQTLCLGQKNKSFAGTYRNIPGKGYSKTLVLSNDGKFRFETYENHWHSEGNWSYDGKNIILNSDIKKVLWPVEVSLSPLNGKRERLNVRLHVPEDKDEEEYLATLYQGSLQDSGVKVMYYHGLGSYSVPFQGYEYKDKYFVIQKFPFENKWIGKMPEPYMKIPTEFINVEYVKGNDVTVDIFVEDDSLFQYIVFENFKVKVRGNKLIFEDPYDDFRDAINDNYIYKYGDFTIYGSIILEKVK